MHMYMYKYYMLCIICIIRCIYSYIECISALYKINIWEAQNFNGWHRSETVSYSYRLETIFKTIFWVINLINAWHNLRSLCLQWFLCYFLSHSQPFQWKLISFQSTNHNVSWGPMTFQPVASATNEERIAPGVYAGLLTYLDQKSIGI